MRLRNIILLAVLTALFFGLFLGSRPLSVPDEGRYVEIPREMVVTGDWVTPRLNGVKYFEKPPLFYWFEAVLIKLFGLSEWSVRLGPALFALFGCLTVYFAGARMFGPLAGVLFHHRPFNERPLLCHKQDDHPGHAGLGIADRRRSCRSCSGRANPPARAAVSSSGVSMHSPRWRSSPRASSALSSPE